MTLLGLLACAPLKGEDPLVHSAPDTAAIDSAAHSGDPREETGDSAADCALGSAIEVVAGQPVPGTPIEVSLVDASLPQDAVITWSSDDGEVEPDASDPARAVWTPDAELATHVAEEATLRAELRAAGCAPETLELVLELDWPEAERVVVLYNPHHEGSEQVALAYAATREVPTDHLCGVESEDDELLAGEDLPGWLALAQACIDAVGEHVHYVVPVYGVPYKVSGRVEDIGTGALTTVSLDALLVFGQLSARASAATWNPLYQDGDSASGEYDPFVPFGQLRAEMRSRYYLVSRIDGATAEAALDLVDRAALARELAEAGALDGTVYVDGEYGDTPPSSDEFGSYESGEWNMWGTRTVFEDLGRYPVVWDGSASEFGTDPAPLSCEDALYYAGWYTYYNYNDVFTWAPGAIGGHLDSCSACSLRDGLTWSSGALERGITATFGAVNEPYVAGMPEYDQLFLYLTQGASFGEAAYQSTQIARWMMVFVGDPLYRSYPEG